MNKEGPVPAELSRKEIRDRLEALYDDLGVFPAGVSCPWLLARVFNELLRQAKQEVGDDPVLGTIAALKVQSGEPDAETAPVFVGAVRGLAAQITIALGPAGGGRPAAPGRKAGRDTKPRAANTKRQSPAGKGKTKSKN